jgi:large subunit ribosomal protein L4
VAVIDSLDLPEIRTRAVWELLKKLELSEQKVLILTDELTENLALSVRNLPNVLALAAREVNTYTVVAADWVLITKKGLAQIEEVFA